MREIEVYQIKGECPVYRHGDRMVIVGAKILVDKRAVRENSGFLYEHHRSNQRCVQLNSPSPVAVVKA